MATDTFKKVRMFVVPFGLMFVAFCPTQNYWSHHDAGEDVLRQVHLTAAGCLFFVGSLIEVHRVSHIMLFGPDKDLTRCNCGFLCKFAQNDRTGWVMHSCARIVSMAGR